MEIMGLLTGVLSVIAKHLIISDESVFCDCTNAAKMGEIWRILVGFDTKIGKFSANF